MLLSMVGLVQSSELTTESVPTRALRPVFDENDDSSSGSSDHGNEGFIENSEEEENRIATAADLFIKKLLFNCHCDVHRAHEVFDCFFKNNLSEYDYTYTKKLTILQKLLCNKSFNNLMKLSDEESLIVRKKGLLLISKILESKKFITLGLLEHAANNQVNLLFKVISFWADPCLLDPLVILEFLQRIKVSTVDDSEKTAVFKQILNYSWNETRVSPIHSLVMYGIESKHVLNQRTVPIEEREQVLLDRYRLLLRFFLDNDVFLLTQGSGPVANRTFLHSCMSSTIVDANLLQIIINKMKRQAEAPGSFVKWINMQDNIGFTPIHTAVYYLSSNDNIKQQPFIKDKIFILLQLLCEEVDLLWPNQNKFSTLDSAYNILVCKHEAPNMWKTEEEYNFLKIRSDIFCALLNAQQKKMEDNGKRAHDWLKKFKTDPLDFVRFDFKSSQYVSWVPSV